MNIHTMEHLLLFGIPVNVAVLFWTTIALLALVAMLKPCFDIIHASESEK